MADQKKNLAREGEMDYDSLLAHYRTAAEQEPPPPPREKKTLIGTLLSDVSTAGEAKFARKRGRKTPPPQQPEETESLQPPLELDGLKPSPRPRKGKEHWDSILKEPVREERQESAPELSQVLESLEESPPEHPKTEKPPVIEIVDEEPEKTGEHRKEKKTRKAEKPPKPEKAPVIEIVDEEPGETGERRKEKKSRKAEKPPKPEKNPVIEIVDEEPEEAGERRKEKKARKAEKPPKPEKNPVIEIVDEEPEEAGEHRKEKKPRKAEKHHKEKPPREEAPSPGSREREPGVLEWIYIEVYYIGIQLLRDLHLFRRQAGKLRDWLQAQVPQWLGVQRHRFLRVCGHISDTTLFPYREIARLTSRLYRQVKEAGKEKGSFRKKLGCWWNYLRSLSRPLNHIANFIAPIVGITILAATLTYFQGINYALSVEYAGRHLGYVARENDFYEAQELVLDRMLNEEYQAADNDQPVFRIVIADEEDLTDPETLANRIIAVSQNEVEEADGVYIGGAFLGALKNGSEFLVYLDGILEGYRTGIDHELVQFIKSVTIRRGVYPTSSVMPLISLIQEMESDQTRIVEHRVEEGETVPEIAAAYDITVEELLELNSMLEERSAETDEETGETDPATISLITGERLTVARVTMDLGVQVTRREVYTEDIPYATTNIEDSRYYKGYSSTISAGVNGKQEVTADVTYIDGEQVAENRIGTPVVLQEPVNARVMVGTMPILTYLPSGENSSDSFMWPVKGGKVTAGLYGYYGHTGMDIAAPAGTEIRASKDGQVTYATNYSIWPYGKRVDISHGNGVMTRYAHCSSVFVTYGQYVRQGDIIALVGRTGNASGNHCHFEIRINGAIMNPANYIGNYWPGY